MLYLLIRMDALRCVNSNEPDPFIITHHNGIAVYYSLDYPWIIAGRTEDVGTSRQTE
jgi:hypothetical protein